MRRLICVSALCLLPSLAGCGSEPPPKPGQRISDLFEDLGSSSPTYAMPAKDLYQEVKRIVSSPPISIPIVKEQGSTFLTDYHEYPGEWHIARRWQERTRYKITVAPAMDDPAGHSTIQILEHTQQRATAQENWHNESDLQRQERCKELLQQIDHQMKQKKQ